MSVKNLTVNKRQVYISVNNMLTNKYIYGQGSHKTIKDGVRNG